MLSNIPIYIDLVFLLCIIVVVFLFYKASTYKRKVLYIIFGWIFLQSAIGLSGFYLATDSFPPRFVLMVLPPLVFILILFFTKSGRDFIDKLSIKILTLIHIVRIPVEFVLFWLYLSKVVPQLMTFHGRNFDILAGITSILVYIFAFKMVIIKRRTVLIWNFLSLGLLLNIMANGILSAPGPFQQFAFDNPNIALLHFPYNLLPSVIVPLVLLSHLASIWQLIKR